MNLKNTVLIISQSFFICLLCFCLPAFSLNPIHNASYDVGHSNFMAEGNHFQGSIYLSPFGDTKLRGPFSVGLLLDKEWEVGFGFKSKWWEEDNNIRHLVFGTKLLPTPNIIIGIDALWGTAQYAGDGLTVTGTFCQNFNRTFYANYQTRLGMFDALVWAPDGFLAMESGFYPGVHLLKGVKGGVDFEAGFFASSQLPDFGDFFGLDVSPMFTFYGPRRWRGTLGLIFGAFGERKADLRVESTVWYFL